MTTDATPDEAHEVAISSTLNEVRSADVAIGLVCPVWCILFETILGLGLPAVKQADESVPV